MVKICIFERSNEKYHFSKTKIYFDKKTSPQLLGHIGLQNMKVGEKTNLGDLPQYFEFVRLMLTSSLKPNTLIITCVNDRFPNKKFSPLEQTLTALSKKYLGLGAWIKWHRRRHSTQILPMLAR